MDGAIQRTVTLLISTVEVPPMGARSTRHMLTTVINPNLDQF